MHPPAITPPPHVRPVKPSWLAGAAVLLLTLLGCSGSSDRTYLVVTVPAFKQVTSLPSLELTVTLDGRTAMQLVPSSGAAPVMLPTRVVFELVQGAGNAHVLVIARDGGGLELLRGSGDVTIVRGQTATLEVALGQDAVDGGVPDAELPDAALPDAAPPDAAPPDATAIDAPQAEAGAPLLVAEVASLGFGSVATGTTSAVRSIPFRNTGTAATGALSAPTLVGTGAPRFTIQTPVAGDCMAGATLAPAQGCVVRVSFTPSTLTLQSATLTLSAAGAGSASVPISGTGVTPAQLSFESTSRDFGGVLIGTSGYLNETLRNLGGADTGPLTVNATGFGIVTPGTTCGATLPGGGSCTVRLRFLPSVSGLRSGVLDATATPGGSDSVAVTGTGIKPATLTTLAAQYNFGSVPVGTISAPFVNTVTNSGDLTTGTITVVPPTGTEFMLQSHNCPTTLVAGASCEVTYVIKPGSTGVKNASAIVNESGGSSAVRAMTATGI